MQDRSEARWRGEYSNADEIRETIDKTRVVIPWDRILGYVKDRDYLTQLNLQQQSFDLEFKVIVIDMPRSGIEGSKWELGPADNPLIGDNTQNEDNVLSSISI